VDPLSISKTQTLFFHTHTPNPVPFPYIFTKYKGPNATDKWEEKRIIIII